MDWKRGAALRTVFACGYGPTELPSGTSKLFWEIGAGGEFIRGGRIEAKKPGVFSLVMSPADHA